MREAILFFFGCLVVKLITFELANQHVRKVLFTCVVCTKKQIFACEEKLKGKYNSFKNIKFPRGNYQTDKSET